MSQRSGASSRCCVPRAIPMIQHDFVDDSHPEVRKLRAWFGDLTPHVQMHEMGTLSALFNLALEGKLVFTNDAKTKIDAIRSDPDIFEIRHKVFKTQMRFYHGEPPAHPDLIVSLHEHIKIDKKHQQEQIDYAVDRYRP